MASVTLKEVDVGGRFLWDNKLHIKTNSIYCRFGVHVVEYYTGKLFVLPNYEPVEKAN